MNKLNPRDHHYMVVQIKFLLRYVESQETTTPCAECLFNKNGLCDIWKETIPDESKEIGCDKFLYNELGVPF